MSKRAGSGVIDDSVSEDLLMGSRARFLEGLEGISERFPGWFYRMAGWMAGRTIRTSASGRPPRPGPARSGGGRGSAPWPGSRGGFLDGSIGWLAGWLVERSELPHQADHHALDPHVLGGDADRLHGRVRRLQADHLALGIEA